MTVHTIMLPDRMHERGLRSVIRDDEAGTVTGEHNEAPDMQAMLTAPPPIEWLDVMGTITLHDPGHDPADFLVLLWDAYQPVLDEPLRSTLPPAFDGVKMPTFPAPPPSADNPGHTVY